MSVLVVAPSHILLILLALFTLLTLLTLLGSKKGEYIWTAVESIPPIPL